MSRSGSNPLLNFSNQWKPTEGLEVGRVREQEGQQHDSLHPTNKPNEGLEVGRVREQKGQQHETLHSEEKPTEGPEVGRVSEQQGQQRVGGQIHQVATRVRQQQPAQDGLLERRQRRRAPCACHLQQRLIPRYSHSSVTQNAAARGQPAAAACISGTIQL